ncbi:MAG: ribbon-helix-helix protein, CopG family [Trueperaceae bacterium]|jgi:Arc/MetJ-type ribon-helix-helix transcriptional regulator|nr:MAG: ribbon-helix-helix protein, CopG family [Trueperaceae bacterium]
MAKAKVAVTIDSDVLGELDALVAQRRFTNRSQAIEAAIVDTLERLGGTRLERELAKLDPDEERAFAEEGMDSELASWPGY